MLAYDPTSNEREWIPVRGMASDLSQAEEASTRELNNMILHDTVEGVEVGQVQGAEEQEW